MTDPDELPPGQTAARIAADARLALGRVRQGWPWLGDAREPGRPGPRRDRYISTGRRARLAAEQRAERDEQVAALTAAGGLIATGPHAAPARLDVLDVRTRVAGDVGDLAGRLWEAVHDAGLVLLVREPGDRRRPQRCPWCAGTGLLVPPAGWVPWAWPDEDVGCPLCPASPGRLCDPCGACGAAGPCTCDRADLGVALHIATIAEVLDLVDVEAAADADETLTDLADLIDAVLGQGKDRRRLPGAECPVCGSRELVPEVGSSDVREWSITCLGPHCLCLGTRDCPCGIATPRRKDRRHRWPRKAWETLAGALDLADRLERTAK